MLKYNTLLILSITLLCITLPEVHLLWPEESTTSEEQEFNNGEPEELLLEKELLLEEEMNLDWSSSFNTTEDDIACFYDPHCRRNVSSCGNKPCCPFKICPLTGDCEFVQTDCILPVVEHAEATSMPL